MNGVHSLELTAKGLGESRSGVTEVRWKRSADARFEIEPDLPEQCVTDVEQDGSWSSYWHVVWRMRHASAAPPP